jgi:hypothetical protein
MTKKTSKRAQSPLERTPMRKLASGLRNELLRKLEEMTPEEKPRKPKKK